MDNIKSTDAGLRELALFAGAGGGILGGKLLGWRTVCAVEYEPHAAAILVKRQNDGILQPFPIWDDVRTFDGNPWRGRVDVVSGGFPCQDISCAGSGKGLAGERSGLWSEMARIIGEVRPLFAFVENSPMLTTRGIGRVLGDLASLGYDAEWGVLGASDVGAPHKRERIWIVANANGVRKLQQAGCIRDERYGVGECGKVLAYPESLGCWEGGEKRNVCEENGGQGRSLLSKSPITGWWEAEPNVGRVANGVAARVDRLKALGNGQVPAVVRLAWRVLSE